MKESEYSVVVRLNIQQATLALVKSRGRVENLEGKRIYDRALRSAVEMNEALYWLDGKNGVIAKLMWS